LPRGLGEDPLSRKKRTGAARSSITSGGSGSVGAAAGVDGPSALSPSVQASRGIPVASSYNEVFFQRRAEESRSEVSPSVVALPRSEAVETVVAEPTVAPVLPAPPAAPSESLAIVPMEEVKEPIAPIAVVDAPAIPVEVASTTIETIPTVQAPVAAESPPKQEAQETQKGGFFNRIFGKLRK
jgi:hypothetical protein